MSNETDDCDEEMFKNFVECSKDLEDIEYSEVLIIWFFNFTKIFGFGYKLTNTRNFTCWVCRQNTTDIIVTLNFQTWTLINNDKERT